MKLITKTLALAATLTLTALTSLVTAGPAAAQTAADPNLYVADYFREDVFRIAPDGTSKTTFIAPLGTGHRFDQIAFSPSGNLIVATNNGGRVYSFSSTGSFLGEFGNINSAFGGVAVDSSGNVYATLGSSVGKYTASGTFLYSLTAGLSTADSLALDASGNLYVANYGNGTVRKFSSTGTDLGAFAIGVGGTEGLAVDPFGNVYVSSRSLNNVQEFNAAGALVNTFFTGFNDPLSVASDNLGNIYVSSYAHGASGSGYVSKITFGGQNLGAITTGGNPDGLAFRVPLAGSAAAPEPSSLALLVLPVVGAIAARRRKIN